jgi:hypothetical protein
MPVFCIAIAREQERHVRSAARSSAGSGPPTA